MGTSELVKKYLQEMEMMQVATLSGDQPWICTVYFVADDKQNLYWISGPTRRHSEEINKHSKAAAAIPVKFSGHPVVGLQAEGEAKEINDKTKISEIMRLYTDKFKTGEDFYNDFVAGKNSHKLYCLKPNLIVLFDEKNFPDEPRKEWRP